MSRMNFYGADDVRNEKELDDSNDFQKSNFKIFKFELKKIVRF